MATTRQIAQGRTDLLMRVEELERRVEALESDAAPARTRRPAKKATPKQTEK